jgi:hypothetical protein
VFVTPTVVDNPDENDSNYNAGERTRLRELAKPIANMSKELIKKRDILSGDETVTAGPGEPLAPIDIPDDVQAAPAAAPAGTTTPAPASSKPAPAPSTSPVPR